jgi:C-terminal processing protease CtpA/Prc
MHVDRITGPFGRVSGAGDYGWDMAPQAPAIRGRRVFLTDGRAISYAESVMGYVADRQLGTIVGAPTAGTNGNVATFGVPGGSQIRFTGMRVTRHDGTSRRHLIGIAPDVPLAPTIDGIRRGRVELLDAAVALIDRPQRLPPTPNVAPLKIRP